MSQEPRGGKYIPRRHIIPCPGCPPEIMGRNVIQSGSLHYKLDALVYHVPSEMMLLKVLLLYFGVKGCEKRTALDVLSTFQNYPRRMTCSITSTAKAGLYNRILTLINSIGTQEQKGGVFTNGRMMFLPPW